MYPRTNKKIKILYLVTDLDFGGTEISVQRLVNGMTKRGFKINICSIKRPGYMANELTNQGFKVTSLNLPSEVNWNYLFYFILGLIRWQRLLNMEMPDIIHSFLFQSNLMAAMCRFSLNSKKREKPIVSSVRCIEIYKPAWRMLLDRWALGKADLVLSVSEAVMKKYLEREKLKGHKIRVVYHGVEHRFLEEQTKESEICVKLGIGREENIIGTVARLHEDKGINILLKAFALALKSMPQIRLLIIGNGPERDKLIEMTKGLGITDRVTFTGFQPDVLPLMSLLDVFCLSSNEEGFPQALLEAMALGKPAIVSNVGGVIELIEDGINGILIPPGNPDILCQSVLNLLQNPHRAQKIGNMAREKIKKKLLIDHTLDNMETIYREMFKNN